MLSGVNALRCARALKKTKQKQKLHTPRDALHDGGARAPAAAAVRELQARCGRLGPHASAHQRRARSRRGDEQGLGQVHQGRLLRRRRATFHQNQRNPGQREERAPAGRRRSVPGHGLVQLLQRQRGGVLHEQTRLRCHGKCARAACAAVTVHAVNIWTADAGVKFNINLF